MARLLWMLLIAMVGYCASTPPPVPEQTNGTLLSGETTCDASQYQCLSNVRAGVPPYCLSDSLVCDGDQDCLEGEDEAEACSCGVDEFTCGNGACIVKEYVCDHIRDCPDRSDESSNCTYPTCPADHFTCTSGACIKGEGKCNGIVDCGDGSDEILSVCRPGDLCEKNEFLCSSGTCIDYQLVCNTDDDCGDNSDETGCGTNECKVNKGGCSHTCSNTMLSFTCGCPTGYRLGDDQRTCVEIDECKEMLGSCTQLCTNTDGSYTCTCDAGYSLQDDMSTCRKLDNIEPWIIFANRYYLRNMSMNGTQQNNLLQENDFIHVLDYDLVERRIYFADASKKQIRRIKINVENSTEILVKDNLPGVEGIAFDWISKKIYWTDNKLKKILVAEADGTRVHTILDAGTPMPRAIAVHPQRGYLYWTDWGGSPYIGRIPMSGGAMTRLVEDNVFWPNGLTLDFSMQRFWWADAYLDQIGSADYDGQNVHVILVGLAHVYALTFFEEWMYFSDWNIQKIEKANRFTGANHTVVAELIHPPYDLHVYHPLKQPAGDNPCGTNNGGCSHLCLIGPGGGNAVCACPDLFALQADGKTCLSNCTAGHYQCQAPDDRCIPILWKCDGEKDCKGGDDESQSCPNRTCSTGRFQCVGDNECMSMSVVCDTRSDCNDGSDEDSTLCTHRVCAPGEFRCDSGKCLSGSWQCDGDNDCLDHSDEANCDSSSGVTPASCIGGQFQCDNNKCIPENWKCDMDNDCGDNSDEPRDECKHRVCSPGWVKCTYSYRCIATSSLCDGRDDCRDNSDEDPAKCPECNDRGDFTCDNGKCIPNRWRCDFSDDCDDNSDEDVQMCQQHYRNCSETEFRCKNSRCIRKSYQCDFDNDCGDNSDEEDCEDVVRTCSQSQFTCVSDGKCIPASFECDQDRDCGDASDERNCEPPLPGGKYCPSDQFECDNHVSSSLY